jgi:hypothetical protein
MTSAHVMQLLLVLMSPNIINHPGLFERLGVQGNLSLAMHLDSMHEEILLMDELLQHWQHKAGKTRKLAVSL